MSASAIGAPTAAIGAEAGNPRTASVQVRGTLPLRRIALRAAALGLSLLAWHLLASSKLDLGIVTF